MITKGSLFPILIFVTMNLTDVFGGVPLRSHENSAAHPDSPFTLDLPNPYTSYPEEVPYSIYTVYTQEPAEPVHVPQPEPEPEPAYHHAYKRESHPQQTQQSNRSRAAECDHAREPRLQGANHTESKLPHGSKNETRVPSGRHSEPTKSLSDQKRPHGHQRIPVVHHSQDPLLHPVPFRHVRKFRVRMPSRTPLNVMNKIFLVCTTLLLLSAATANPLPQQPPQKASGMNPAETDYYGPPGPYGMDYRNEEKQAHATQEEEPAHGFGQAIRRYIYITTEYMRPVLKCLSPLVPPVVINLN